MTLQQLEQTIDTWINTLQAYDTALLNTKPGAQSWSLAQVYMHLVEDTNFYADQAESCLTHNDHQHKDKTKFATALFANNGFPDERIQGEHNANTTKQPTSGKQDLMRQMEQLKKGCFCCGILLNTGRVPAKPNTRGWAILLHRNGWCLQRCTCGITCGITCGKRKGLKRYQEIDEKINHSAYSTC